MTEEQKNIANENYDYAKALAYGWAKRKEAMWCIDEIISMAGIILLRTTLNYNVQKNTAFKTYLYQALENSLSLAVLFAGKGKKNKKGDLVSLFCNLEDNPAEIERMHLASSDGGMQDAISKLEFEEILSLTKKLNEKDKEILRYLFIDELTDSEISRKIGCTREAIRQRKERIFDKIKKMYSFEKLMGRVE